MVYHAPMHVAAKTTAQTLLCPKLLTLMMKINVMPYMDGLSSMKTYLSQPLIKQELNYNEETVIFI